MDPQDVKTKLGFDEILWYGLKFRRPHRILEGLNHLALNKFSEVSHLCFRWGSWSTSLPFLKVRKGFFEALISSRIIFASGLFATRM